MKDKKIVHLIYASTATQNFTMNNLIDLLTKSRIKNHSLNITGILLYIEQNFFQILEGDEENVNSLFEIISKDKRHDKIIKIIEESIPKRIFQKWDMGFGDITAEQLHVIKGLNDFFTTGTCLTDLDAGRSKKLLEAFSKGYWRRSIK